MDDAKNIMLSYSSDDKVAFSLDCASDYLLVPQPLPKRCKESDLKSVSHGKIKIHKFYVYFDSCQVSMKRNVKTTFHWSV